MMRVTKALFLPLFVVALCYSAFADDQVIATCEGMLFSKDDGGDVPIWTKFDGPSVSVFQKSDGLFEAKFKIEAKGEVLSSEVNVKDYTPQVAAEILFAFDQGSELHKAALSGMKEYQVVDTPDGETQISLLVFRDVDDKIVERILVMGVAIGRCAN